MARWQINNDNVFETSIKKQLGPAGIEKMTDGPEHQKLTKAVTQSYRILMTRAMKGIYIWIEDKETRDYVTASLHKL